MTITCASSISGDTVTVRILGRFDFSSHQEFQGACPCGPNQPKQVIVEMSGVEYVDSSALGMLLVLKDQLGGAKGAVTIKGCRPDVLNVLTIANFHQMFSIE